MNNNTWAIILGGSDGIGLACAKRLAKGGFNLLIVHRDRRARGEELSAINSELISNGIATHWINADAALPATIDRALYELNEVDKNAKVSCLLHSIARGNVKPLANATDTLTRQDLHVTADQMAFCLLDWVKALHQGGHFTPEAAVIALTSEGSQRAIPQYAAVGMAKAALEALCRSIALEYAPFGIRCNSVQPGVCLTNSFYRIPGHEEIEAITRKRNPAGRLTTPEDVAGVVHFLTTSEARWINGANIPVDGGERIA